MDTRYWFAIISMIFLVSIASTATATIAIGSDINVACSPLSNITNTCYKGSTAFVTFRVTDNNAAADDFNVQVCRARSFSSSTASCFTATIGGTTDNNRLVADLNLNRANANRTVCLPNVYGFDYNFVLSRTCIIPMSLSTLDNGNYDVNVTFADVNTTLINSRISSHASFGVNNAITSSAAITMAGLLALVLMAGGALYAFKTDAIQVEQLLVVIIGCVIIAALLVMLSG